MILTYEKFSKLFNSESKKLLGISADEKVAVRAWRNYLNTISAMKTTGKLSFEKGTDNTLKVYFEPKWNN
ncbi:MAG: hypothetical protein IPM20_06385 [Gammaproteobacteria bacterium]|nr:hypothetical protein [Gammaproteobacteria bacterium]